MFITLILRCLQLIFAAIILGLSISLIRNQYIGNSPTETRYASFVGGLGLLVAIVNGAALIVSAIGATFVPLILDAITSVLALAGGIALAVALGVHSCSDLYYTGYNKILNGGHAYIKGQYVPFWDPAERTHRCHEAGAVTAFLFFSFAAFAVTSAFSFLAKRRGGGNSSDWA